ncbi:MAG: hypothetical protein EON96_01050, partial [Caulobacteraceae bacterium]
YTFYQNLPSFYNGVRLPQNDGASPNVLYTDPGVFVPLSPSEVSAVTGMMGQIQALVNINFIHTTAQTGTIGFGAVNGVVPDDDGTVTGYYNPPGGGSVGSDIWLTTAGHANATQTLLHELGHALGLRHTHESALTGVEDTYKYSVMAYKPNPTTGQIPVNFQLYDVAALHFIYGARESFDTDSVHDTFSVGGVNMAYSLWDSGGEDTIAAQDEWAALIDLRPGYFSSLGVQTVAHNGTGIAQNGGGTGNISIAFGALIENARGGAKGDILLGNARSNLLSGGGGDDLIYGEGTRLDSGEAEYERIVQGGLVAQPSDPANQQDVLLGEGGDDSLYDGRGSDLVSGDQGSDFIALMTDGHADYALGGAGKDTILGEDDRDIIFGDGVADAEGLNGLSGRSGALLAQMEAAKAEIESRLPGSYDASGAAGDDMLSGGDGGDLMSGGGGSDALHGEDGDDLLLGDAGNDELFGEEGDDVLLGGSGDDALTGGAGHDVLHGGDGRDRALYDDTHLQLGAIANEGGYTGLSVTADGAVDQLLKIEEVRLETAGTAVSIVGNILNKGIDVTVIALETPNTVDTLSFAGVGQGVTYDRGLATAGFSVGRVIDMFTDGGVRFSGFDHLTFTAGRDRVRVAEVNTVIDLGAGDDRVDFAAAGSQIWTGEGRDVVRMSDGVRIMDLSSEDRVSDGGGFLSGGIRWAGSAVAFAFSANFGFAYGINGDGDLVIRNAINRDAPELFVAGYAANFQLSGGNSPGGIHVAQAEMGAFRVIEDKPSHMSWLGTWELFLGHYMKANLGVSIWKGVDPLVLDLDGDGLELTGASSFSPFFDYDGDGFGERGGWVSGDDGLLVLDQNQDGRVSDVGELFGGPGLSGFAELALHDLNADGKIDATDAVFSALSVWRDLNQNRVVDAGEMFGLAELGIVSIDVTGLAGVGVVNGNDVLTTGGFTRADGSTGLLGDVGFRVDQQRTEFLGDRTISAAAAVLPELKGFGTLVDLRIAMTLEPGLQAIVSAVLPTLDTLDLGLMREAILPLFTAWADSSPLGGAAPLGGHDAVPVLTEVVDGARVVVDYAYRAINAQTGVAEWRLASSGVPVDLSTLLNQPPTTPDGPEWNELSGEWIDFFERYLGEALPLGREPVNGEDAAAGLQGVIAGMWQTVDLLAVRIAMQGPLSEYFDGLTYDVASDSFRPTTVRQLIPMFEAVFTEVAAMPEGGLARLEAWREILDVVIGDYRQPDGVLNTNGFLFSNIVAAFESTGLALDIVAVGEALGLPSDLIRVGDGVVAGGDDADLFYLGAGNQIAVGGLGPDTYVVGRGFGQDVINDLEPVLTTHSEDVVRFADIESTEVTAVREGLDLVISINGTTDTLRVTDHFDGRLPGFGGGGDLSSSTGVDFILFADGVQWTPFDIARAVSRHTAGDDTLLGTETVDWLDGGIGNDFLSGGNDSDVYVYGHGYGHDTVSDRNGHIYLAGPDYISFTDGIALEDLRFSRSGASDDLLITVDGQAGSLTLINQFAATYTGVFGVHWIDQIEGFMFDDGMSLDWLEVAGILLQQASTSGDDAIYGFSLEDRLDGGAGNDFLSGGNENDTYVFGAGYGHDTIHERWSNILSGGIDTVEFTPGALPEDVAFTRDGDDLIVTITAT